MFRKLLDQAEAGDNIGVLLRGIDREEIERGQVLAKPGSITPHTKFEGEVYVLSKEEGGRHTPFFNGYRPQFYFRTTDVTGVVKLPEGTEMVMPGDNIKVTAELISPIAMEEGLRFAIREGGRTVGAGVVTKVLGTKLGAFMQVSMVFTCLHVRYGRANPWPSQWRNGHSVEWGGLCSTPRFLKGGLSARGFRLSSP